MCLIGVCLFVSRIYHKHIIIHGSTVHSQVSPETCSCCRCVAKMILIQGYETVWTYCQQLWIKIKRKLIPTTPLYNELHDTSFYTSVFKVMIKKRFILAEIPLGFSAFVSGKKVSICLRWIKYRET